MGTTVFMGKFQVNESDGSFSIKSAFGKKIVPKGYFNRAIDRCEVVFRPLEDRGNQNYRGGRGGRGAKT